MRQLTGALYLMDSSLSFHPEDYPDEFRNLLLVRSFAKAKKIYDGFLSQYSSDLWTERADASLDLSGVNGDFAAYAALKDILYFLKTHPVKAYIENAAAGRSMGDYIQHYYRDRNSEPVKFSAGSLYIEEKVAHFEYERIKKDSLSLPVYLIDETKYFKDFRTFLFVSSFDHYTSENNISLSGASEAEKRKSLETHFDAFLSDPLYSVNSRTFSQRYSGSAERQKLMNLIYDKLNRNLTALHFLPDSLSTMVNEGSIESFYKNPEDLLPEALKTIPDYDTADYRQMAASLGDGALSALAFLETEEYMKGKSPALFLSDEELQVLIDRSGYGDAPEQIQTILSKMLRSQNSIVLPEHLKDENYTVSILRSRKVFDVYFPRGSERNQYEVFQAREGGRIDRIENKFFNALDQSGHQLREKAKRNRGEFFSALAEIYRGDKNNSYFLSLEDSLKKDFEDLKNRLFQSGGGMDTVPKGSVFTSDEITSILENQILYEKIFAYRSDLELVLNGAFSESRKYILGKIQRAATDRLLDAAKRQKTAVLKDFLEKILNEEKAGSALISFKAEFPSEHLQNEYRELLSRAYQDADPSLIKSIASERVLVRRMLEHYMIPDVVLNETEQSLLDPSVSQPSLKGSILLEASKRKILAEKKETEILSSFSGMLAEHERYFKKKGLELEREKQVGIFSETYARSFSYNPAQSASISSFSSYRTFLEPGENQETEGPLFITKEIFTEVAAKRIFEKSNWQEILVPDDAEFYGISEVSADDTNHLKKDSMNEIKRVKAFIQNGMSEQEIFQEFHYANLANHYLESISSFNQAFADLFHAAAMAEKRVSPDTETLMKERFRNAYDAAEGGKKNYEKAAAIGIEFAVNSSARDSESIRRNYKKYADAVRQRHELTARFSDTARRKMLFHMKGSEYISKAAASAAEKYHRAEERLKNESDKKTSDRIKHAELISRYTDLLNESGKQYRKYIYSAQKFNSADSVRNYAQTPYLLAFNQNSDEQTAYLKKRFSDAQTLYDVAAAEFHEKEKQLKTASYKVRTERKIEDLKKIISILSSDNSELAEIIKLPLDDNEKVALYELNEKKHAQNRVLSGEEITKQELLNLRNDYENFHDLIESRSEFINHSLRMTRLRKASEIITAEIERKRAVVEAKRDEFENSLNALMPAHAASESSSDDVIQARNAVYQRLVSVLESGGNLSLEFRSWYYTEAVWA
ncbi:MAG: hypothetical protein OEZ34_13225, partial [Spirochaetia bacterium]|nr:hypothetical protein [Spirochaetia bacterium]